MSDLVPYAVVWEKGKTMDFSETIVVYDIKSGRCNQLNEYNNFHEYQISIVKVTHSIFSNFFSLETTRLIEAKFHMKPPWFWKNDSVFN